MCQKERPQIKTLLLSLIGGSRKSTVIYMNYDKPNQQNFLSTNRRTLHNLAFVLGHAAVGLAAHVKAYVSRLLEIQQFLK